MPAPFTISVAVNRASVVRELGILEKKQLPFAIARAMTHVADRVRDGEVQNFRTVFEHPRPFTLDAIGIKPARKSDLEAWVFVKDKTATYLEPYELGGDHVLPGRALLNPKSITLDQYGQIPKGTLAKLRARPDVFVGTVKTKKGPVSGVWQRPFIRKDQKIRGRSDVPAGSNTTGRLKLLIRFGNALPVKKHLDYRARASAIVARTFNLELTKAMVFARGTAR